MVETEFKGYFITEDGRVWSSRSQKFLKPQNSTGYLTVTLKGKSVYVHRLVARAYCENKAEKVWVNHKDGNKLNNHYLNLEWCTPSENISHAFYVLRAKRSEGENHRSARLKKHQVIEIKKRIEQGEMLKSIAEYFGVPPSLISNIKRGKKWKSVEVLQ